MKTNLFPLLLAISTPALANETLPCQAQIQGIVQQIFELGHPGGLEKIGVTARDEGMTSTGKYHMYRFWLSAKEQGAKGVTHYEVGVYHYAKDGSCDMYQLHSFE